MSTEYILPHTHQALSVTEHGCTFDISFSVDDQSESAIGPELVSIVKSLDLNQLGDIAVELIKIISYFDDDNCQALKDRINDHLYR